MSKVELPPEQDKLANELILTLREHLPWAKTLIRQIIQEAGEDFARQLLEETQQIQAEGGMLTLDGTQNRTIGGIFFYLARNRLPDEVAGRLFARENRRRKSPPKHIEWEKRIEIIEERLQKRGKVSEMHISMIG
ncbi:MAG: phosphorylated adapter RNA export RNA-binding domain-containing protein, partial [Aggregatilineales bacterium]